MSGIYFSTISVTRSVRSALFELTRLLKLIAVSMVSATSYVFSASSVSVTLLPSRAAASESSLPRLSTAASRDAESFPPTRTVFPSYPMKADDVAPDPAFFNPSASASLVNAVIPTDITFSRSAGAISSLITSTVNPQCDAMISRVRSAATASPIVSFFG